MPKITFISHDNEEYTIDALDGQTVMEAAIQNGVPGIDAECGGACSCATCHVYIGDGWIEKIGSAKNLEEDMLDFAFDVRPQSRLSCQIIVNDDMEGAKFHIPEHQG